MGDAGARADRDAGERLAALAPQFLDAYGSLRELYPLLARAPGRLSDPVRLAVVGQIKKGKSTLVNAILGRRLAVTREEEATYRVNEFRFGTTEGISAYYPDGPGGSFRPQEFSLDSLAKLTVHDPDRTGELLAPARIVVRVREERLKRLILIDTPGLHSVHGVDSDETQRLLSNRSIEAMDAADAILYLFDRDIGGTDIDVVRVFLGPGSSVRQANAAKAVGVMSRCDQNWRAGSAASDPIAEGARRIRSRYDYEPELRRTFYEILPVAAIVAEGAQCLSTEGLAELRKLADWNPDKLIRALKYPRSESFRSMLDGCPISPARCVALKEQLGAWGLFQAFCYMRDGCNDTTVIENLVDVSGVAKVRGLVSSLYEQQRYVIKVNALLDQVRRVIENQEHAGLPSADAQRALEEVRDAVEYITDNQAGLTEMQMTRLIRQRQVELDSEDADRIARLAETHRGIAGRLGVPGDTAKPDLLAAAKAEVRRWRGARYSGRSKETRDVVRSAVHVAEDLAARLGTVIQLEAEAQDRLRRAAELMGESQPRHRESGPVDIFGRERQRAQQLAEQVARHAVAVAGGAVPPEGRTMEESLSTIDAALSALAEARENSAREVQRLVAAGGSRQQAIHASPRSMLILAELRDRLRTVVAEDTVGDHGAGTLPWVIARLDEALADLEVCEFADDGAVDVQRHYIVDRRPADSTHPPGTIARSVRSGLTLAGALLRPQQVVIYADGEGGTDA